MSAPSMAKTEVDAALAVHGKLLREIRGSVGVGHGAGRQQEQLLKSRSLSGRLETWPLERCSPPLASLEAPTTPITRNSGGWTESWSPAASAIPSLMSTGAGAFQVLSPLAADTEVAARGKAGEGKLATRRSGRGVLLCQIAWNAVRR